MKRTRTFDAQAREFHRQVIELVKKYQFRDRNQTCCRGVSVSQCYVLEVLHERGPLTMNELAERMHLSISPVTRIVDRLVEKRLARREVDGHDRRIRLISLTSSGESTFRRAWKTVFQSEKDILRRFPEEHRDMLIDFLAKLNEAVTTWQARPPRRCSR